MVTVTADPYGLKTEKGKQRQLQRRPHVNREGNRYGQHQIYKNYKPETRKAMKDMRHL
jgi:hypothetical protein